MNKSLSVAGWIYGVAFIGSTVAMLGLVAYCAITGEMVNFGGGH